MLDGIKFGAILGSSDASENTSEVLKTYELEMLERSRKEQDSSRKSSYAVHKSYDEWTGRGKDGLSDVKEKREVYK